VIRGGEGNGGTRTVPGLGHPFEAAEAGEIGPSVVNATAAAPITTTIFEDMKCSTG
jgi:hypothetical protein